MFRWSTVVGRSVLAPAVALAVATAAALPATNPSSRSTPMPAPPSFPVDRDPYGWPFRQDSIWNLPIADEARYVAAGIQPATERGMTVDEDIIVLAPDAPPTDVYTNFKGWSDRSAGARCVAEGPKLASLPIPPDWTYGHDEGSTPNASAAILQPDGETLFQTQPFHRCQAGSYATSQYVFAEMNIRTGDGIEGAHGGSRLSSIGGTLRLGELVPGGVIHHALKVNIFGKKNMVCESGEPDGQGGYRWPALTTDGYACDDASPLRYGGTNPSLQLGALLALRPDFDLGSFETEPARILARAFQDYGAYVVDDTAWDVYALLTERGPAGRVVDEFEQRWGFAIDPQDRDTPWARDMDRIFQNVQIVENNGPATPGGGALGSPRRQPLAPPFRSPAGGDPATPAPPESGATPPNGSAPALRSRRRRPRRQARAGAIANVGGSNRHRSGTAARRAAAVAGDPCRRGRGAGCPAGRARAARSRPRSAGRDRSSRRSARSGRGRHRRSGWDCGGTNTTRPRMRATPDGAAGAAASSARYHPPR